MRRVLLIFLLPYGLLGGRQIQGIATLLVGSVAWRTIVILDYALMGIAVVLVLLKPHVRWGIPVTLR